jgi:hypothetical protein
MGLFIVLTLFLSSVAGWPLLAFAVCRYLFGLSNGAAQWIAFAVIAVELPASIGYGDWYAAQHGPNDPGPRPTPWGYDIVVFLPYAIILAWFAIRLLRRSRHSRETRQV